MCRRLGRPIATPCRLTMSCISLRCTRPCFTRYATERTGGAAGGGILDDAGARREHAAVDGHFRIDRLGREEQRADVAAGKRALQPPHRREIGFRGIDRRARPHRDQQERVAARHFLDRQARRIDRRRIESNRADDVGPRRCRRAELRRPLIHPRERQPIAFPRQLHLRRTDAEAEDEALAALSRSRQAPRARRCCRSSDARPSAAPCPA